MIVGILLIAINLRGPLTGIGPVLIFIRQDLQLSPTQAGMITTLPLLVFAFFSPIISTVTKRMGLEALLMLALVLLAVGISIRSFGSTAALFAGTLLIGVAIATGNVLLPALLKRDLPQHIATMTAMYVLAMGVGSTLSASLAVPINEWSHTLQLTALPGWAFALLSNLFLCVLAILLWLPQLKKRRAAPTQMGEAETASHRYLWRTPAAWYMTLYLGLNSFIMYVMVSWLPAIVMDKGFNQHDAGLIQGLSQLGTALPALILIPAMARINDKRLLATSLPALATFSIIGLFFAPQYAKVWALLFGFGAAGGFIIALSLIGLRTHNVHQAAALSGICQCIGYLFAASGPTVIGLIHQVTSAWTIPLIVCIVFCAVLTAVAPFAANKEKIMLSPKALLPARC
ncbi:MAG: MFS transporter [Gammaproteobacteria bacterium]|nr:MFS transporter [Gammaproteobacteria bacterium]